MVLSYKELKREIGNHETLFITDLLYTILIFTDKTLLLHKKSIRYCLKNHVYGKWEWSVNYFPCKIMEHLFLMLNWTAGNPISQQHIESETSVMTNNVVINVLCVKGEIYIIIFAFFSNFAPEVACLVVFSCSFSLNKQQSPPSATSFSIIWGTEQTWRCAVLSVHQYCCAVASIIVLMSFNHSSCSSVNKNWVRLSWT